MRLLCALFRENYLFFLGDVMDDNGVIFTVVETVYYVVLCTVD